MPKPTAIETHISALVRDRRAPPCPRCGAKGSLAGADIGQVQCNKCYVKFENLRYAWRVTLENALRKEELNSGRGTQGNGEGPEPDRRA